LRPDARCGGVRLRLAGICSSLIGRGGKKFVTTRIVMSILRAAPQKPALIESAIQPKIVYHNESLMNELAKRSQCLEDFP
jgi:hypothetical protein